MFKSVLIKDYMATNLTTFTPGLEISQAIKYLNTHKISGAPVVDERGTLVGMLSEKDCLQVALQSTYYEDWVGGVVSEYMTEELETVPDTASIVDVAEKFLKSSFKRYPVLDEDGELVGQISRSDVLRALDELW
ncbi:MAG: CBS domain-containing protein [Cycloclasticus pugetii]|jgi:CBS domain-containing protein|uniref:Signal transduction protein with CBS domains n=2 Tax=Cycloclasticus TaxID=34067 RepID=S5TZH6_9GAMM|nr:MULTISPECIES: CBS domain-containing protein [Cycloclasticus]AFT66571.1 signal transduction protein with CBS domains [Cycloclasticus sp. P1]AGS40388.1 Signal transduction protein with CBS domains [Cycloclasticus zancles 78-ME]ATI03856.1 CBS domain-containing protein [Cycloclasticus sp. PY97N]EPD14289.1 signal transduction protein with CBS domains [Cycloclasticus pugetii]MBV1898845.1 CBS domain-containing protein [Cycloclasticus sp.]|tara:strand:- start:5476 stop:5877 length:402 start_codon:yes stop_codon:yes gene_type:complete